jgi:hypothetical protein
VAGQRRRQQRQDRLEILSGPLAQGHHAVRLPVRRPVPLHKMPNQLVGDLVDAVAGRHRVRQLVQHRPSGRWRSTCEMKAVRSISE